MYNDGTPHQHSTQDGSGQSSPKIMVLQDDSDPNQSFDWLHSTFGCSASDMQRAFDFNTPIMTSDRVDAEPESLPGLHPMIDNIHYPRLFSPQVCHAPYTIPRRYRPSPSPREGTSQSAASFDPSPSPVLDVLPPAPTAPLAPSPALSPAPSPAPSLAPATSAQIVPSILFGLADLTQAKLVALFRLKCKIFASSFLPNDDSATKKMATDCLDKVCRNSPELSAWTKMTNGKDEIVKMCSALVTIRKNMQALTRSAVLWGYGLHQLLHTEKKGVIKEFVGSLLINEAFLRGVITVNGERVNIPFAHQALQYYIRQLLFHDKQYRKFIGIERNLKPLYTYTSVLFKWALTEMSSGAFKDTDFKIIDATAEHDDMVTLFETLTKEQIDALTTSVFD
ncbi:uncharacterized protein HD556DRAFT_1445533 [Suillus plorans]|uniref:DUF6532 domain-containing protein n=1 Tax=Suillus plorans TaxID=116603 RepID=A0A9P7AKE9_9AGAM|nr:uncharacterized protein HD556DRAFT_1445533 [Suillus plorans]KAG1791265.1 hypothetical protein HD556DRAFT_1445533 [Suillus plorans]